MFLFKVRQKNIWNNGWREFFMMQQSCDVCWIWTFSSLHYTYVRMHWLCAARKHETKAGESPCLRMFWHTCPSLYLNSNVFLCASSMVGIDFFVRHIHTHAHFFVFILKTDRHTHTLTHWWTNVWTNALNKARQTRFVCVLLFFYCFQTIASTT